MIKVKRSATPESRKAGGCICGKLWFAQIILNRKTGEIARYVGWSLDCPLHGDGSDYWHEIIGHDGRGRGQAARAKRPAGA
jgi:hypothetical protein